ncbi:MULTISPECIES: hypothetical protein [Haloarcula]|uniref:Uncharacterized protein n=3 Tax=Haloarcula TaxID=2237 RepID=A0ACC6VRZ0_9EURY|nr:MULTISPECIES: hypothetical protein [Haloarcula]EMA31330.1 Collagen triple helix repeat-containing protein [Haloarcula japonica DSM 6131]GGK85172.1 hypothetical protein GCM10009067_41630 [Haloarcula sebkhae]
MYRRYTLLAITVIALVFGPVSVATGSVTNAGQGKSSTGSTLDTGQIRFVTSSVEIINLTTEESERHDGLRRGGWIENKTVAVNETVFLNGLTNLRPDDHAITVDVLNSEFERVAVATTDQWGTDGVWRVELNTTGFEPGTYTIEATAADTTDRIELRVIEPTPQRIINETETPIQTTTEIESNGVQNAETDITPILLTSVTEEQATVENSEPSTEATGTGFDVGTVVLALMLILLWSRNS